jgi:GWxTD domain-containing protein
LFDSYTKAAKPSACTKSGYDFLPRVYPFYGSKEDKLNFYVELYNSDKLYDEGKFLVSYYIEAVESSNRLQEFSFNKRFDVKKVDVLFNTIDIKELPSGNYHLVVEMRDRANTLICSQSAFFQRSNPGVGYDMSNIAAVNITNSFVSQINNIDTLRQYIRFLDPICSEAERDYTAGLVKTDDLKTMQQFFLNFWSSRAPLNPSFAWNDYLNAVRRVNMSCKTISYPGYRSDRGYVFLKYGQPDKIMESPNEPGAYPYEIWHYYEVANQRNKRFVFMSKDDSTNDYHLIHSDVVGEINNPRWQLEIYSRIYGEGYDQGVDQTEYEKVWGSHAGDLYNNPR